MTVSSDPGPAQRLLAVEARLAALEDRLAVLEHAYDYQRSCDGGWSGPSHADPRALTELFTPDARYALPELPVATGHAEIEALFGRLTEHVPWIVHYLANPFVSIDGNRARLEIKGGACFWRGPSRTLTFGTYHHELARTADGWRFADWEFTRAQQPFAATEWFTTSNGQSAR
jgi:hypothetical protein